MTQKKFTINVTAHYSGTLNVEAASESEATDKANALLREGKMPMFEFGDILAVDEPEEVGDDNDPMQDLMNDLWKNSPDFLLTDLSGRGFASKVKADHLRNYTDDQEDQKMINEWLVSSSTGDELRLDSEATKITRI